MLGLVALLCDMAVAAFGCSWLLFTTVLYLAWQLTRTGSVQRRYGLWDAVVGFLLLDFAIYGSGCLGIIFVMAASAAVYLLRDVLLNAQRMLFVAVMLLFFIYHTLMHRVVIGDWLSGSHLLWITTLNVALGVVLATWWATKRRRKRRWY